MYFCTFHIIESLEYDVATVIVIDHLRSTIEVTNSHLIQQQAVGVKN